MVLKELEIIPVGASEIPPIKDSGLAALEFKIFELLLLSFQIPFQVVVFLKNPFLAFF